MNERSLQPIRSLALIAGLAVMAMCTSRLPAADDPYRSGTTQSPSSPLSAALNPGEKPSPDVTAPARSVGGVSPNRHDTPSRSDGTRSVRRWAIVSSESLRATGFPDLVTGVLANVEGVATVERDQLDAVIAELALPQLRSPDGSKDRQRLGVLVGAQRLLMLDGSIWNGTGSIAVQVVDTYSGVNLFRGRLKLEKGNADGAAERLGRLARDLEKKYADGIHAVIGIPYFVSKTAGQDYASLQEEFPDLLAAAVKTAPGVAVLSVREAQLIQTEMSFSGHSIKRFLPLFVSGEYEIYERQVDDEQRLRLSVTITDGTELGEKIERDRIALSEARELLRSEAAESIFKFLSRKDLLPLTREQQEAAWIGKRMICPKQETLSRPSSYGRLPCFCLPTTRDTESRSSSTVIEEVLSTRTSKRSIPIWSICSAIAW